MKKLVRALLVLSLGGIGVGFFGCAENTAATAKCKEVKDGDECSKCCSSNGASGHTYVNPGSGCTCRGG